ncbi:type VI secretion system tip protein VgrG [Inquilinus limosus]|uniref:type VI secretion system Vgr family protein n=1 Tax=Inquilinus limosus TaxID=171674 RepID=UPI003F1678B9
MTLHDYVGTLTQQGRLLAIETPIGPDVFLLEAMEGEEEICALFSFRLRVRSKHQDVTPADMVGLPVSWSLELPGGARREWSGVVGALEAGPMLGDGMRAYTVTAHPWLWLFGHTSDCRIFQHQTTQQILETIFAEANIRDHDFKGVIGPKAVREYCVQYNETDLTFIFRLLEEEGWAWWFRHEPGQDGAPGRHVLVVADGAHAWTPGEEPTIRYATTNVDLNDITVWTRRFSFLPGRVAEADWNFETPRAPQMRDQPSLAPLGANKPFEIYHWGGRFTDRDRADHITKRRIEAREAQFETVQADSGNRRLHPGQKFTLTGHPAAAENAEYAVVSVRHAAQDTTYVAADGGAPPGYVNSFVAIPAAVRYTPALRTPQPRIDGVQTATVVGPPGEEIHTDRYGRIKVRFPWDRYAKGDDGDSCWLRVSQPWGGRSWGSQTIPRIGMEVLVAYVEGDPDKPLVVGVVPNAEQMPPLDLPANKTRTSFKSSSSPGGAGFNELSFEDKAGAEEVFLHAQKDASEMVNNNKLLNIGNAYTAAAQMLHMTTVQNSMSTMTPADIVLQHKGSMIRMDESGITISFGSGHAIELSDEGVRIRSTKRIQAVREESPNFLTIDGKGIHARGKEVIHDVAGDGAHHIQMSAKGIGIHSDTTVVASQAQDNNFVAIDREGVRTNGRNSIKKMVAESTLELNGEGISQKGPLIRLN